jgi:plasmid maintenance system antidote protein VapI
MVAQRTAKRLLLGREIAYMIREAGVNHQQAADLIEVPRTRIGGLIEGTATIRPGDLEMLAKGLGFTSADYLASLRDLRRDNHKRGFWNSDHRRAYAEDFRLMVDLERHADLLQVVQVEMMPGLLQCESYVRALHSDEYVVAPSAQTDVTTEDYVKARLARQEVLLADRAPEYRVVMSESCLRREYGTRDVMREQADHLIKMSKSPGVMIQVIPFKIRPRRVEILQTSVVLRVQSPGVAGPLEMVYVESDGEVRYIDDNAAVSAHNNAWTRLSVAALNPEDTRTYIELVAATYR